MNGWNYLLRLLLFFGDVAAKRNHKLVATLHLLDVFVIEVSEYIVAIETPHESAVVLILDDTKAATEANVFQGCLEVRVFRGYRTINLRKVISPNIHFTAETECSRVQTCRYLLYWLRYQDLIKGLCRFAKSSTVVDEPRFATEEE